MPLDTNAKRLLDMMAAGASSVRTAPSTGERRSALAKLMQFARADRMTAPGIDGNLPGPAGDLRYRRYAAEHSPAGRTPGFVFFHGGGLVAGSIDTHDLICRALAQESGCRLVSIDYRLAPEHQFPAAVQDAIAATAWVSRHADSLGIDAAKLVVGGDSAGATLAAIVCQDAAGSANIPIALQCLICPVLDFSAPSPSRNAFTENYLIDKAILDADLVDYLPEGIDPGDPRISPLRAANLSGAAAAIIHTAEFDPMRDEGKEYAKRLTAAGITVDHTCHAGMVHNFHALGGILPQGRHVLRQIGEQIQRAFA